MKKTLLPLLFVGLLIGNVQSFAQCTPDAAAVSAGTPGFFPDPTQSLPAGEINVAYGGQTITVIVPGTFDFDTLGQTITATVNTMTINGTN